MEWFQLGQDHLPGSLQY